MGTDQPTFTQVLLRVVAVLDDLGAPYLIGGSLASSVYGIPRSTNDIDLVVDLEPRHVGPLIAALGSDFLVDRDAILDAMRNRRSFNLIHMATLDKIDMFMARGDQWRHQELERRQPERIVPGRDETFAYFASPEDIILAKLDWHRRGGGASDRQWGDILGVLRVQGMSLDLAYLRQWAVQLDVSDALERALATAGLADRSDEE